MGMMHGGDRWPERARNSMEKLPNDHRVDNVSGPEVPTKLDKDQQQQAIDLLHKYLAMHGDWREVTHHRVQTYAATSVHQWEFAVCQCEVCQAAEKLVGHPTTPQG